MTVGSRIKRLRKNLKLTQAEFAERIGLKSGAIGLYESNDRNVTDRSISLICEKFSINEDWLRTGEGNMEVKSDDSLLEKLSSEYHLSKIEQKTIAAYLRLDELHRNQLIEGISYFINELSKVSNEDEVVATTATRPAANDTKLTRAQKEEMMKRQLDAEEKGVTSSVFTTISGLNTEKMA